MNKKFLSIIEDNIAPILQSHSAELVDAEYKKEGANKVLRLFVELIEGNITLDDCAIIAKEISQMLDESDPIDEPYVLEVSSPGVNRILRNEKDYLRFLDSKVDVSLYESIDGQKKFPCILKGYRDGVFAFETDNGLINVPADKVGKINLHFEF